jgi:excisionase family DNA binding protein
MKKLDNSGEERDHESIFLKVDDVAVELKCSKAKVYTMVNEGALPSVKLAGLLRIPRAALEKIAAEAR